MRKVGTLRSTQCLRTVQAASLAVAKVLALVSAGMSGLLFVRKRPPWGLVLWAPKLLAGALSPLLAVVGLVGTVLGVLGRAPSAVFAGALGVAASARYVWRVVTASGDFDRAFGPGWQARIPPAQALAMLKGRWTWNPPHPPQPRWERDVAFWPVPGSDCPLLCDLWQPPAGVTPSGMAVLYLHGSAWSVSDKDMGTRPLFRHLAAQGHVVMDVAYRLCPEVELRGMVGDVKRAIAWMKAHSGEYGVDPQRIVLAGGSAGAHLALLAAYTPHHPELVPEDVQGADLSVRAVVSYYAPVDLRATAEHNRGLAPLAARRGDPSQRRRPQAAQLELVANALDNLLGGRPDEVPAMYDLASPLSHVHPACPPTLLIQGEHDVLVPVAPARALYEKLMEAGVPAVYLELPQTDHGFDLMLPRRSPPAQVALYEVERFLALVL